MGYHNGSGGVAGDINLVTGSIKKNITIFGVTGDVNVVDTSSGTAATTDILSGKTAFVAGSLVNGVMVDRGAATITPAAGSQTIPAGYHNGSGLVEGDTDLATGNIKKDITIFGITGDDNVVDTSSGTAATTDILCGKTAFVAGSPVHGVMVDRGAATITPAAGSQTIPAGYHNGSGLVEGDTDLATGNIKKNITIFGVTGDNNVVDTSSGTAEAGDILSVETAFVAGSLVHGTRPMASTHKTGQRFCTKLDGSDWVIETDCSLASPASQDGDLREGIAWPTARFTSNSDGTVTDNLTGLIWLKDANCQGETTWSAALTFVETLQDSVCGLFDFSTAAQWRVPTITELLTLVNYNFTTPTLSNAAGTAQWTTNNDAFSKVQSASYWSSTTRRDSLGFAFNLNLKFGTVLGTDKGEQHYLLPVRNK